MIETIQYLFEHPEVYVALSFTFSAVVGIAGAWLVERLAVGFQRAKD